jgi:hypothetical protein
MRFLLLLSALLSAIVAPGVVARPVAAESYQVARLDRVAARKAAAILLSRPAPGLPRLVALLDPRTAPALAVPATRLFLDRLRV